MVIIPEHISKLCSLSDGMAVFNVDPFERFYNVESSSLDKHSVPLVQQPVYRYTDGDTSVPAKCTPFPPTGIGRPR